MGRIAEELKSMIAAQVDARGIVVWYDPEEIYGSIAVTLAIPDTTVLIHEGSFLRLREKLEPFLEFIDEQGRPHHNCGIPPRVVIYVPCGKESASYAMIEAECAGAVLEPGAHTREKNSRLSVVAACVFGKIAPDRVRDIVRKTEEGLFDFESLERLSTDLTSLDTTRITLVFGTHDPSQVTLSFLSRTSLDDTIISKGALPELASFFSMEYGFSIPASATPSEMRRQLRERLLIGDIADITHESLKEITVKLNISPEAEHLRRIRDICAQWRNRLDYRQAYIEAAEEADLKYGIEALDIPVELCIARDTFLSMERLILNSTEQAVLDGDGTRALSLAEARSGSFWMSHKPQLQLQWAILRHCAEVLVTGKTVKDEIKKAKKKPEIFIRAYVEGESPWFLLDRHYRALESLYSRFELDLSGAHDRLELVMASVRTNYTDTIRIMAESFVSVLRQAQFQIPNILAQPHIFHTVVIPRLGEKEKTALLLVDSLRFEMGSELLEGLHAEFDSDLQAALAQPPTLTSIGFASLLPGAEKGLELCEASESHAALSLGSTVMKDRATRIQFLKESLNEYSPVSFKLKELLKPTAECKRAIGKAGFVIITSQELDRLGESGDDEAETRVYMDEVLDKLRKVIRRLAALEVTTLIVTSDHGHIFGEALESGMKMESPGGNTVELHRRVWIGRGGNQAPGYVRVAAHEIGLGGDLECAFPVSIGCFLAGGGTAYLHGGLSLQEMVIPVIVLKRKSISPYTKKMMHIELSMDRLHITTRLFSVTVAYSSVDFFSPDEIRVRALPVSEKKEVGFAAVAAYGYEPSTKEITLVKDKPNVITFMLTEEKGFNELSVLIYDTVLNQEIARLVSVPVKLTL